jgi:anti-sigma factor RsiW
MTNCAEAYRFICDNLDEKLDSPRCRRIRRHLAGCPDCSTLLDSVKKTVTLYRMMPVPGVPSGVHETLLKTMKKLAASSHRSDAPQSGRQRTRRRPGGQPR